MKIEFEMTDIGLMKYFLGIEVEKSDSGIFICQQKYAKNVLNILIMKNGKLANTLVVIDTKLSKQDQGITIDPTLYKILLDILMYLTTTRLDIMELVYFSGSWKQQKIPIGK